MTSASPPPTVEILAFEGADELGVVGPSVDGRVAA
jgi:hypothetical protein